MIVNAKNTISLGRLGENEATVVCFSIKSFLDECPNASFVVLHKRPCDINAYPVSNQFIQINNNNLYWTVQSGDLACEGSGQCELIASDNGKIIKSAIYRTIVYPSLDENGTPPEPWESWVQDVESSANRAESAANLLEHPSAEATTLEPGLQATASYSEGVFTFGIPTGTDGQDGQDGHSPVVTATKSNGVTTVSVDGEPIATINDGADGQNGQNGQDGSDGADGYSPTATVSKSGSTATISITDKNGTTTATVTDGQNGQNGQDGQPGVGVPSGGTDGQMLVKDGATDYATKWVNQPVDVAWELICEDTVTNATEAGIEITVDGNGNAFQLTDVVLMFETPQQANEAKKAGYGAYYFYYKDTNSNIAGLSGTWTQAANASANGCVIHIENNDDMIFVTSQSYSSSGNANNLRRLYKEGFSGSQQSVQLISDFYVHKVSIPGVTGKAHYKLYGKRKPT